MRAGGAPRGMLAARRRRYDVAVLLLTGEGGRREKLIGALAGARVTLAYGKSGEWHELHLPPYRPWSGRWWARMILAKSLSCLYLLVLLKLRGADWVWRLSVEKPPILDPGPPVGRTVTLIVPTYNQKPLMDFCLPPLLAEAWRQHRVMVVDDASTDGTAEYVRQQYPAVKVLRLERNQG